MWCYFKSHVASVVAPITQQRARNNRRLRTQAGFRRVALQVFVNVATASLIAQQTANGYSAMSTKSRSDRDSLFLSIPYEPPVWCRNFFTNFPDNGRLALGNFPTPLYRLECRRPLPACSDLWNTLSELNNKLYIKRDDLSGGVELGGNKIRKLEFLLSQALQTGCDSVVTIGGEQSNHCRATASASRMVGLEPHLILRSSKANDGDLGLTGNLLIDRMVGSQIYMCTPGEYGRIGSTELVSRLCTNLKEEGLSPYPIPVGGSNGIGTWGYIRGVDELLYQWKEMLPQQETLDHIVVACGSGGTTAGICLGIALHFIYMQHCQDDTNNNNKITTVHAVGVCDDEDYFYRYVAKIADEMGFILPSTSYSTTEDFIRKHLQMYQGKGMGYAQSTAEELDFCMNFAEDTGVVLDPVYSGKALYQFLNVMRTKPDCFKNQRIMFWHTGGTIGMFDKLNELKQSLEVSAPCHRLDVYGTAQAKTSRINVIKTKSHVVSAKITKAAEYYLTNGTIPKPKIVHSILRNDIQRNKKILVIGDIHGCYDELIQLIEKAVHDYNSGTSFDYVISVGDLVNKGPKSVDVVQHFRSNSNYFAVRGNHDDSALRAVLGNSDDRSSGKKKYEWINDLTDDDIEWMLELPYTIRIPSTVFGNANDSLDVLVVHAGLIPEVKLEEQDIQTMTTIREVSLMKDDNGQQHYLFYDLKNTNDDSMQQTSDRHAWATVWKGPYSVVFGHDAKRGLQIYPQENLDETHGRFVIGLDTGCCYGKKLSGLILPDRKLVQVDALDIHCPIDD